MLIGHFPAASGDFSSYEELAYYSGPYSGSGWLTFPISSPKCGRYFAMVKDAGLTDKVLEITEIRLYTKF